MSVIRCHHICGDAKSYLHAIGHTEASSEHPIAKSIVCYVKAQNDWREASELSEYETVLGQGVKAIIDGCVVVVGNENYMIEKGIHFDRIAALESDKEQGRTIVYAGISGEAVCAFVIGDQLKSSAKRTVSYLQKRNIVVAMASGDNQITCQAIANELGIAVVYGQILPEGKAKLIKQLQRNKQRVAFVGDGVNDSPALVVADLGIAFGEGTEIAMEAADIVLMKDDLFDVVAALNLSTTIFRRIKMNFVWASIYNLTGVPLAAGVFSHWGVTLHPMVAGGMMAISSVSVVGSSLRLRYWKRPSDNAGIFFKVSSRISSFYPFNKMYNRLRHHGSDLEMV
jgi:Cu+-exporting ATPase